MDYDLILRVLVCYSSLAGLAVVAARVRPIPVGWIVVYTVVSLIAGIGWLRDQQVIVYFAAALWLCFILLPGLLGRLQQQRVMQQRFLAAYRLARIVSWLHPADGWREMPMIVRAFQLAQQGDIEAAADMLRRFEDSTSSIALQAVANLYRITGRWEELLAWQERHRRELERCLPLLPLMLRTRGEVGDVKGMIELYASRHEQIARLVPPMLRDLCRQMLFTYCGRRQSLEKLFSGRLSILPDNVRAFWLAKADQSAGNLESAQRQLKELLPAADPLLRRLIERHLAQIELPGQPQSRAPEVELTLAEAERDLEHDQKYAAPRSLFSRRALVTQLLILACLAAFAAEICLGGSSDGDVLYRLGALEPDAVFDGQWWRLFTPLFLHWGPWHLAANMLALWLLGPFVEFSLGHWRYLLVYLLSGIGSSAAVLLASRFSGEPMLMVGASGCIMGLIGAMGAMMLRGWTRENAQVAKRRLVGVIFFVAIQTVSDAIIPHISMTAHLSGAVIGFAVTAVLLQSMRSEK